MNKFLQHKWIIFAIFFVITGIFYWYEYRPSQIKKQCSTIERTGATQDEKEKAQKAFEELECRQYNFGGITPIQCVKIKRILEQPISPYRSWASEEEYKKCLRLHGL